MSNYTKATNFAAKDSLPSGNAGKIIKGTEIDTEYNAIASAISSKADTNSPTFTGTPLAPTQATATTSNTQIATTAFVQAAIAAANLVPSGTIVLWSGSVASIPTGWVLCNGSNGTPDLRNRFVVGAGSTYAVDGTGGSADAIVVSHNHTATSTSSVTDPGHAHTISIATNDAIGGAGAQVALRSSGTTTLNTATTGITVGTTTTVASTGSSGTNANLPPYYALAYIMKS
jgi:microcystin-dependent protein